MCKERMAGRFLHRHAGLVLHTSDGCSCKLLAVIVHKGFGFTSFWRRKKELGTPPVPGGAVAGSSTMCTGHAACCKTDRGGLPDHFLLLSHMEWKHEQVIAPEITFFFVCNANTNAGSLKEIPGPAFVPDTVLEHCDCCSRASALLGSDGSSSGDGQEGHCVSTS